MKKCGYREITDKFRKIRPGAYFLQNVLGYTEFNEERDLNWCEALWLEIPLSIIGLGKDFNFTRLAKMKVWNVFS